MKCSILIDWGSWDSWKYSAGEYSESCRLLLYVKNKVGPSWWWNFRDKSCIRCRVQQGDPQGGVPSPLTSTIQTQPLPEIQIVSYPDDCTILATVTNISISRNIMNQGDQHYHRQHGGHKQQKRQDTRSHIWPLSHLPSECLDHKRH